MTRYLDAALGAGAALVLALGASAVLAHPEGMEHGMQHGMAGHGQMAGSMHGGGMAGQQLMTPQERESLHQKMAAAKSPEERQALAAAMHAEMEKRARDGGIARPEHRGPHGGMGQH